MRGLPSCGKSTTARQLAGSTGVICETDEFFYTQIGELKDQYDYDASRLDEAREWNLERFRVAPSQKVSPVIVDRGNGRNPESRDYVVLAKEHGYRVSLREPDSPWWLELRVLLKYKKHVAPELLDHWAQALAERNAETHRVPVDTIRRWMQSWRSELTIDEIINTGK